METSEGDGTPMQWRFKQLSAQENQVHPDVCVAE